MNRNFTKVSKLSKVNTVNTMQNKLIRKITQLFTSGSDAGAAT